MQTLSIASGPCVHHGALAVPRNADAQYEAAKRYLSADPVERRLFDRVENAGDGRRFHLRINHQNNDYFNPNTDTIGWDPRSALRTTGGGTQTPALGLGHEIAHAAENPRIAARLMRRSDPAFDNKEERRVILGSETHAARTLGEATRHDHRGEAYQVRGPLSS